ncbi:hypothetical protein [Natronococcus wangiae]|uniref:hypothetical protein n=1 Tax=Natronococcus wangiae TaxID=3068275 RepID=UPI00273FA660|nr:hypothetical protein [Natronococcus sp. AD5]
MSDPDNRAEACGRCSMTTVLDATEDERSDRDILEGERIELEDAELRRVSPHVVLLARFRRWLDDVGSRLAYRR